MNKHGNFRIFSTIILIIFILLGITVFSVISTDTTDNEEITLEEEIEQMLNDALDSITKNVQITDKIGKYYGPPRQQKIQKIAIMIKPMISTEIDLSNLIIKISDGETIRILSYSGHAQKIGSNTLFDHPIWNNLTENDFGLVVTLDKDNSMEDFDTINKNNDMAYIVIQLPSSFYMQKGDTIVAQIFPSSGISKTTILEAPLPMKSVVQL